MCSSDLFPSHDNTKKEINREKKIVSNRKEFLRKSSGLNVKKIIIPYSRPIIREKKQAE